MELYVIQSQSITNIQLPITSIQINRQKKILEWIIILLSFFISLPIPKTEMNRLV